MMPPSRRFSALDYSQGLRNFFAFLVGYDRQSPFMAGPETGRSVRTMKGE